MFLPIFSFWLQTLPVPAQEVAAGVGGVGGGRGERGALSNQGEFYFCLLLALLQLQFPHSSNGDNQVAPPRPKGVLTSNMLETLAGSFITIIFITILA